MKTLQRAMIQLLLVVIGLGYLMLFIMLPTSTYYQTWRTSIRDKTKSTFFGQQVVYKNESVKELKKVIENSSTLDLYTREREYMDSTEIKEPYSSSPYEWKKMMRAMIKLLLLVIFLGYTMFWFMTPTKAYWEIWVPSMLSNANSTFYGYQGANLLVFTFPVLFVAALGCVYIHLGKNSEDDYHESETKQKVSSICKSTALVRGPLGIVSWIELAFFTMFVTLLIWAISSYLHNGLSYITPKSAKAEGFKLWEAKLEAVGLRLGLVGNICLCFLFYPVTRGSSVLPLVGLTSEASIKYHIWLGHIVMVLFTAHGACYIILWASTNHIDAMLKWDKVGVSNVAGELSLLAGLAMWATSFAPIRRKMFELFFYTHNLYSLFIIFFILHVGISYSCIMIPGFYLFLIDRYIRFLQSRQRVRLLSSRILPCDTVELNFSKNPGLDYTPTSIIFIQIPSISRLQWHPFTISSNSNLEPERLSVIIKSEGSWSQKLHQILSSPSPLNRLDVSVEGPYGPASTHFLRHDMVVMVSGGSGITPFFSIIREIIFRSSARKTKTPRILLISAFKNSSELTMLNLLLPISGTPDDISRLQLRIEAFVTREKHPPMNNKNSIQTIWFKPNASDKPISPILGRNSYIWLGVIICSSFLIFLILLAILTQYYIYPIDHNTGNIFPTASKSLLNMLLICGSIAITASIIVLRNKKQNAMEDKQIQSTDAGTPMTASPGSWFYNADRELESLPSQSILQGTNVTYGARPDLQRLLCECAGSSVGVLVCGPSKMRHEVATICLSGLADNLHFESISFSW